MTSIPQTAEAPIATTHRGVRVWDAPTRLFHWSLFALLLVSWFTGEAEGAAAMIHRLSGEAIAGLIVFRLVWGFVGGEHARFAGFLTGPGPVGRHLAHVLQGRAEPSLGHNPLGGLSVVLLLLAVAAVVTTGLFSAGDEGPGGPLAGLFGIELSALHEPAFRILQGLVVLHLAGVLFTSLASRDNLIGAMITGRKRREAEAQAADARPASGPALVLALLLAAATSGYLMSLPHPGGGERDTFGDDEEWLHVDEREQHRDD